MIEEVNNFMNWENCLKIIYGELEVVDSDKLVYGFRLPKDIRVLPDISEEVRCLAYQEILRHNMDNVELECPLFHYVALPHFVKAVLSSAFFLARPYTWSKSDDPAFNAAIKTRILGNTILSEWQRKFLGAYMRNTFGMCWSRKSGNENLIAKKIKDGGGAPIVEIQSTASKLLSAYLTMTDPVAPAKYFLVDMVYVSASDLKRTSFSPEDLELVNYAFQRHREMLSLMANKYKTQDEVRLIVERVDNRGEELVEDKFFPKKIDLSTVITGIRLHGWNRIVNEKAFVESYAKLLNTQVEVIS